jgi:hypothetical protein
MSSATKRIHCMINVQNEIHLMFPIDQFINQNSTAKYRSFTRVINYNLISTLIRVAYHLC